jgi:hypothetical protein
MRKSGGRQSLRRGAPHISARGVPALERMIRLSVPGVFLIAFVTLAV